MDLPKTYRATVRLGFATETYDAEGNPTGPERAVEVMRGEVESALQVFAGEIEQTPPAYSAVKVDGQPAYRLARKGAAVALRSRLARIYAIRLLEFESPEVVIEVECGKGTYIRSLAHDLGQALGCGGHLVALDRTRVGQFSVDSAVAPTELVGAFETGDWREMVLPRDWQPGADFSQRCSSWLSPNAKFVTIARVNTQTKPAERVIQRFGGQSALAGLLGRRESTVEHWATTGRIPAQWHGPLMSLA